MTNKTINLLTNVIYYGLYMPINIFIKIMKWYFILLGLLFGIGYFINND